MSHSFKVGDRVHCYHPDLIDTVRGRKATITQAEGRTISAYVDDVQNPSKRGWSFNPDHLKLVNEEPTDEEIAALFGLNGPCPHCSGTGRAANMKGSR
jgi:hypothetical protein